MSGILTEEELNSLTKLAHDFQGLTLTNVMTIVNSHRNLRSDNAELPERNRLLVLENDELTAEIERLKQALNDVWEVDSSDWELAVRTQYSIIAKALGEPDHD